MNTRKFGTSGVVLWAVTLAGCGGGAPSGPATYAIGGSITGLAPSTSVVLSDNGQDSLTVSANAAFTFRTPLESGGNYNVAVVTEPPGQLCTVTNSTGTVAGANITNILVTCGPGSSLGGTVTGLAPGGSVVLLNNGGDAVTVNANGAFKFPTLLPWNTIYLVSVGTQPSGQTCTANYASGDAITDVTNVIVQCTIEVVLWSFGAGVDGAFPSGPLIQGSDGNLYGVTSGGGTNDRGAVYKITPSGNESVLWSFGTGADGTSPTGALVQGPDGAFYGTTSAGGAYSYGTVYKVTPAGVESIIWNFGAVANDGQTPDAGLLLASDGNWYGTTLNGGSAGYGTVFKITPGGAESVLWNFWVTVGDANQPVAALIQATDGNFYGTSSGGGAADWGTVYEITPGGVETVLWSFIPGSDANTTDGIAPVAPLVQGGDGKFYGTTYDNAAIFQYSPADAREFVLWRFRSTLAGGGINDGDAPEAGLMMGKDGNFYGTTDYGGTTQGGTAFKFTPGGIETVLWNFGTGNDGQNVKASLIQLADGNLYGTTTTGGTNGKGTVFRLTP